MSALISATDLIYIKSFLELMLKNPQNIEAYKAGLIDDKFNVIRKPENNREKRLMSPFKKMCYLIRKNLTIAGLSPRRLLGVATVAALIKKLNENYKIPVDIMFETVEHIGITTYKIKPVISESIGNYNCEVYNLFGHNIYQNKNGDYVISEMTHISDIVPYRKENIKNIDEIKKLIEEMDN